MGKYFGTDGIRGKYGDNLDAALAYQTGLAVSTLFGAGDCYVGRDTRVSGPEIEAALVKGITEGGGNVKLIGVLPTPAVARLAIDNGGVCGIMISASHNPPEYNGIKIFDGHGVKLTEEQEGSIEYYIDNPPAPAKKKGSCEKLDNAAKTYVDYLVKVVDADFSGLKIWLDCGYGAASPVAKEAFTRLGADVMIENFALRGEKINAYCGALYPTYVRNSMQGTDYKIGFAYDGDADRLAVVYDGEIIDGDSILYNISRYMDLKDGVVVGTVLTNLALEKKLAESGKKLLRTPVGDKYICDLMFKNHYNLGGEQSGHFIAFPQATTGDGIMSSMLLCKALYKKGKLEKPEILELCPQKAIAEYANPSIMYDKKMLEMIDRYTAELHGRGRIIVRMSGTEPKVRVMVECDNMDTVDEILKVFKTYIRSVGV